MNEKRQNVGNCWSWMLGESTKPWLLQEKVFQSIPSLSKDGFMLVLVTTNIIFPCVCVCLVFLHKTRYSRITRIILYTSFPGLNYWIKNVNFIWLLIQINPFVNTFISPGNLVPFSEHWPLQTRSQEPRVLFVIKLLLLLDLSSRWNYKIFTWGREWILSFSWTF